MLGHISPKNFTLHLHGEEIFCRTTTQCSGGQIQKTFFLFTFTEKTLSFSISSESTKMRRREEISFRCWNESTRRVYGSIRFNTYHIASLFFPTFSSSFLLLFWKITPAFDNVSVGWRNKILVCLNSALVLLLCGVCVVILWKRQQKKRTRVELMKKKWEITRATAAALAHEGKYREQEESEKMTNICM